MRCLCKQKVSYDLLTQQHGTPRNILNVETKLRIRVDKNRWEKHDDDSSAFPFAFEKFPRR